MLANMKSTHNKSINYAPLARELSEDLSTFQIRAILLAERMTGVRVLAIMNVLLEWRVIQASSGKLSTEN